jgi:short-subunit dehydrogenase
MIDNSPSSGRSFAVITGASYGIGFELAKQFTEHAFDVLVSAEDDGIEAAAKRLGAAGTSVQSIQVDLVDYDGVEKLYTKIQSCGRPVNAIAINASVGASGNFARDTELKAELNLIALNVTSSVHLARRVVHDMVDRKQGRILFTSSVAGRMPASFEAVYGASKALLFSFSEALRSELQDFGVTVTALMPGAAETNFFRRAGMENIKVGASEKDDPADVARDGFEALMAGKDKVIAGSYKNEFLGFETRVLPESAKAQIRRKMAEPRSAR